MIKLISDTVSDTRPLEFGVVLSWYDIFCCFSSETRCNRGQYGVTSYKEKFFNEAKRVTFAIGMLDIDVFNVYLFLVADLKIEPNL